MFLFICDFADLFYNGSRIIFKAAKNIKTNFLFFSWTVKVTDLPSPLWIIISIINLQDILDIPRVYKQTVMKFLRDTWEVCVFKKKS